MTVKAPVAQKGKGNISELQSRVWTQATGIIIVTRHSYYFWNTVISSKIPVPLSWKAPSMSHVLFFWCHSSRHQVHRVLIFVFLFFYKKYPLCFLIKNDQLGLLDRHWFQVGIFFWKLLISCLYESESNRQRDVGKIVWLSLDLRPYYCEHFLFRRWTFPESRIDEVKQISLNKNKHTGV